MAVLDDELLRDAQLDAEIITHVRAQLPQEMKECYDDEMLYYFHDLIEEYLAQSGVLEAEPDEEGFIFLDMETMASSLAQQAKKDKMGDFLVEELLLLCEAELSYGDDFDDANS